MKSVDFHMSLVTVLVPYDMENVKSAFLPDILKNFQARFPKPGIDRRRRSVLSYAIEIRIPKRRDGEEYTAPTLYREPSGELPAD